MVSSFGDFSQNGSPRGGELMSRHTVLSRNPMSAPYEVSDQRWSSRLGVRSLAVNKYNYPFLILREGRSDEGVISAVALCNL